MRFDDAGKLIGFENSIIQGMNEVGYAKLARVNMYELESPLVNMCTVFSLTS